MQSALTGGFVLGTGGALYLAIHTMVAQFLRAAHNTAYTEKHKDDAANDNFEFED